VWKFDPLIDGIGNRHDLGILAGVLASHGTTLKRSMD
jgi:hypothetical protein